MSDPRTPRDDGGDPARQDERPDEKLPEITQGSNHHLRYRDGFKLTDPRGTPREVMGEVDYCVICHEREKDSCSTGFKAKDPVAEGHTFKKNPLGIPLTGCPLDERISEAHALKREGNSLASLAVVMVDNPMCPGTGHRICNECMKACIFQKQEPVNIPMVETAALTDVLGLPLSQVRAIWMPGPGSYGRSDADDDITMIGLKIVAAGREKMAAAETTVAAD